jgi:branched-chain amino acid transport system ATP-binding protein
MDHILEIENLSLSFGGLQVLRNVGLDALRGKVTALIGPNGAGKTALLNCVSGIYRPQTGHISFNGENLIGRAPEQIARLGIARSFQNLELFPSLTVVENLLVARDGRFRGNVLAAAIFFGPARRREIAEREAVERVIDFFELWPLRHVRAHDLPYGQQKIVGFARAMAADPKLLLLDEPGSGLTRDEKEDLARFILRLRFDWKVSILWIEHDLQLVTDLADRVHVLNIGECIASGTPEEVKRVPAVISAHVGDEPIAQPWRRASSSDDGPTSDGWGSGANIAGGLPQSHYFAGEAGPLDDVRYGSASPPTPAVLLHCRELT